jgi:hypothetical protein
MNATLDGTTYILVENQSCLQFKISGIWVLSKEESITLDFKLVNLT